MVKLEKIYTRGGDKGETSLGDGSRVPKNDLRVAAYGTVDEVNASLGIARLYLSGDTDEAIARVQNDLFDLGADLACPEDGTGQVRERLRIVDTQIIWLEGQIDSVLERQEPLTSFVLPGGSPAAAHLHVSRTIVRRAERYVAELSVLVAGHDAALRYLNRLSDYLFVLSRQENSDGAEDVLWKPGEYR